MQKSSLLCFRVDASSFGSENERIVEKTWINKDGMVTVEKRPMLLQSMWASNLNHEIRVSRYS